MERQVIRSIRKGSVQWNEEDRIQLAEILFKCGILSGSGAGRYQAKRTGRMPRWSIRLNIGRKKMFKWIAKKPTETRKRYLKYGFVITECQVISCPRCGNPLSAGPAYQPAFCSSCGQKLDFKDIVWKQEQFMGYAEDERRKGWDTSKSAMA